MARRKGGRTHARSVAPRPDAAVATTPRLAHDGRVDSVATPPSAAMATTELVDLDAPGTQSPPPGANTTTELVDLDAPPTQPPDRSTMPPALRPDADAILVDLTPEEIAPRAPTVTLCTAAGVLAAIPAPLLRRDAVKWSQIMKNRERWRDTSGEGLDLPGESRELFRSLGLDDSVLRSVAEARVVEVGIPFIREDLGWEARIFPWEALLSAATKPWRDNAPLFIVRHLERELDSRPANGTDVLYVQSVPAKLRYWDFESERQRIETALPRSFTRHWSINDTRDAIAVKMAEFGPGLIHVAGFDTWQGAAVLGLPYVKQRRDGLMLSSESGEPDEFNGEDLLAFLRDVPARPWLVGLNVYNSAARLAALAVAGGARAAIGFQDIFDDDLAEVFFARVYNELPVVDPGSGVLQAFLRAQESLQKRARSLTGSGIVLWSEETIANQRLGPVAWGPFKDSSREFVIPGPGEGTDQKGAASGVWPFTVYKIKPYDKLNYSMLHNKCDVFENFVLYRGPGLDGAVRQVTIRAELYLGLPSPCSWEQTTDIEAEDEPVLHTKIRLPLISELQRSLKQTLRTNLMVRIEHDSRIYYQETFPVELLAIDEWRDDDMARAWLPSFVMPGDPIVPEIVDAAQRYLTVLVDDEGAGFDGYQGLGAAHPGRPGLVYTAEEVIDPQVRAIWSSLWQDFPLKYINQPPTYTRNSQRVRPPSAVIAERRGTCIDLALLMASCLEHADLYPVIFLLQGHAVPGYWRDPVSQRKITFGLGPDDAATTTMAGGTTSKGPGTVWLFDRFYFPKIRDLIDAGALVPIETVGLTRKWGFRKACSEARDKITPQRFEAMMDVRLARDHDVTPLPMTSDTPR